jgi:hypothetical protein
VTVFALERLIFHYPNSCQTLCTAESSTDPSNPRRARLGNKWLASKQKCHGRGKGAPQRQDLKLSRKGIVVIT